VRADVADRAADAGARRIGAPFRLLLACLLDVGREPILHVLGMDEADLTELA